MSWGEGEAAHGNILKMNLLENRIVSTRETIDLSSVRVYPYLSLSHSVAAFLSLAQNVRVFV